MTTLSFRDCAVAVDQTVNGGMHRREMPGNIRYRRQAQLSLELEL